jgi:hypothetical protein
MLQFIILALCFVEVAPTDVHCTLTDPSELQQVLIAINVTQQYIAIFLIVEIIVSFLLVSLCILVISTTGILRNMERKIIDGDLQKNGLLDQALDDYNITVSNETVE